MQKSLRWANGFIVTSAVVLGFVAVVLQNRGNPLGTTILQHYRNGGALAVLGLVFISSFLFSTKTKEERAKRLVTMVLVLIFNWGIWHAKAKGFW